MRGVFFIVGPTASGKSELAADVARELGVEIVNADAFQIYEGFEVITAKPDAATLAKARHHLIGMVSILEEMNAEKFRRAALEAIAEIHSRGKTALVVGGSGLYIKALTHGLHRDWKKVDVHPAGVFVLRGRAELYDRINRRVEAMFNRGIIEEVRAVGAMSETASKMIGVREIRQLLAGKMSMLQCIAAIQQATRRYAKRQLTWFRRQTNFPPLNLSGLTHKEAVHWISLRAQRSHARRDD
ncbi:MAG TPA: tRNA (adenosine(37)-N6)-dimethylallyltransferase MiaA [Chthoniobacterales bacterium]|nr:tRNA (adenosine(37)-N6)-dimethylallyltransferase MiaA [Chthoniobacterales bacterium]